MTGGLYGPDCRFLLNHAFMTGASSGRRDKTRAPGKKPVAIETVNKVLALTQRQATNDREDGTGDESILPIKGHSVSNPSSRTRTV